MFAETVAMCGLALIPFGKGRASLVLGSLFAATGLFAGVVFSGFLMGASLPFATLLLPLLIFIKEEEPISHRPAPKITSLQYNLWRSPGFR